MATRALSSSTITPDLQQIKQFQATSGRAITPQAIQGITQQAIKTAAGRAEQQRAFQLKEKEINNLQSFRDQSLTFNKEKFGFAKDQQAIENQFRQSSFNQDIALRRDTSNRQLDLRQQALDDAKVNNEALIGLKGRELDIAGERLGIAKEDLGIRQQAQEFNQNFTVEQFNTTNASNARIEERNTRGQDILDGINAGKIKAQKRVELRQSFGGFMTVAQAQQLAAFDARPASSFLPGAAPVQGPSPVTVEQLTPKQQRQQALFGRSSNF